MTGNEQERRGSGGRRLRRWLVLGGLLLVGVFTLLPAAGAQGERKAGPPGQGERKAGGIGQGERKAGGIGQGERKAGGAGQAGRTTRGKVRELSPARDPEAIALMLRSLDRYAKNVTDKSPLDRRVEQALNRIRNGRQMAQRIVDRYGALQEAQRERWLGKNYRLVNEPTVPDSRYDHVAKQLKSKRSTPQTLPKLDAFDQTDGKNKKGGASPMHRQDTFSGPEDDTLNRAAPPRGRSLTRSAASAGQQYRIKYKGLRCREETDSLFGIGSDEIYVITNVIDGGGETTTKTPIGGDFDEDDTYEDVDTGDRRSGPTKTVWRGRAQDLTLLVTVWEHDSENPEQTRIIIQTAAKALYAIFGGEGDLPDWMDTVCDLVGEVISALIGDDLISKRVVKLTGRSLQAYVDEAENHQLLDWRGITHHFYTRHRGQGGDYYIFFKVFRE